MKSILSGVLTGEKVGVHGYYGVSTADRMRLIIGVCLNLPGGTPCRKSLIE